MVSNDVKVMVADARNGPLGEFYNQVEDDKALGFLLLILFEQSKLIIAVKDEAGKDVEMSETDRYEAVLDLFAKGYISLTMQEDGSIQASASTPEEAEAFGTPTMISSPTIN